MSRLGLVALLLVLGLCVGYLVRGGGSDGPRPRAPSDGRLVKALEIRVAELERRLDQFDSRTRPSDAAEEPAGAAAPAPVPPPRASTPEEQARDREEHRQQWLQRFRQAAAGPARLAALRDAHAQIKKHSGPATLKEFLEEAVRDAGPASEEGIEATFLLSYQARGEGDYARSDQLIRGIERLVSAESPQYADTQFQLAWNRKYAGDPAAAEDLFRRAADAAGVDPGTKAAALYAIASLRGEAGDATATKAFLESVLEEGKRHPAHQGVAYYVTLAKKLLDAGAE